MATETLSATFSGVLGSMASFICSIVRDRSQIALVHL